MFQQRPGVIFQNESEFQHYFLYLSQVYLGNLHFHFVPSLCFIYKYRGNYSNICDFEDVHILMIIWYALLMVHQTNHQ